jgi:hypothetical protein
MVCRQTSENYLGVGGVTDNDSLDWYLPTCQISAGIVPHPSNHMIRAQFQWAAMCYGAMPASSQWRRAHANLGKVACQRAALPIESESQV